MNHLFALLLAIISPIAFFAQNNCTLKGKITDEKGNPIPYCSIYLPNVGNSSMSNLEGDYSINLPCAENEIVFQSMGFETKKLMNKNAEELNVQLKVAIYQLKAVEVDESSEDIAYNYIRKATAMAEFYKRQMTAFTAELYIRSYFDIKDIPWLFEKLMEEEDKEAMQTGNITETIAEYSYKRPNEVKERIIATKSAVMDTNRLGSGFINLNFYNLGGTGIINPLSRNAFQVYEYEHISTYFENEMGIHKIKIIPRRKGDDLMSGHIYINDKIWNINKVDVSFEVPLAKIAYQQQYAEIKENAWMPINHQLKVKASAVGFKADIHYLATSNKIEIETDPEIDAKIEKHKSKRTTSPILKKEEVINSAASQTLNRQENKKQKTEKKIESLLQKDRLSKTESVKLIRLIKKQEKENEETSEEDLEHQINHKIDYADSAFAANDSVWSQRDVPLSEVEANIYKARDSLERVKSGDTTYSSDSVDIINKIMYYNGTIASKNKNIRFKPKGLLNGLGGGYNTVDGYLITKKLFDFEWNNRESKYYLFSPWIGYSPARKTILGGINYESQYNYKRRAGFYGSAGRNSVDFDREYEFSDVANTFTALFFKSSFKKLYQSDYVNFGHQFDVVNGLQIKTTIGYENRQELFNNTDRHFIKWENREFTSNQPDNNSVKNDRSLIANNEALLFDASVNYTFKQHYTYDKYTKRKRLLYSKYPTLTFNYRKGIKNNKWSDADFDFASFSIQQSFAFRLLDKVSYFFEAGTFFNQNTVAFADFKNFAANPSYLVNSDEIQSFGILDNYRFSSNDYYFQGHLRVTNDHILLKYLPLLNQTSWDEELKFNHLITEQKTHYSEIGYTLKGIFLFMNVGAYAAFEDGEYSDWGLRIGLNLLGNDSN